ncbi:MAG: hypothetical protein MIO87_01860 [Methanomassiliicoccales archaeon]|nr:hypothetical protein [Methanomassiliicoccales archaeon]
MAKVVMIPRTRAIESPIPSFKRNCEFVLDGKDLCFDCLGCPVSHDAPTEECLQAFRYSLEKNPGARSFLLRGENHVWLREKGLDSLRSLISVEKAWETFRITIRSLPCRRPLSTERVLRYLDKAMDGRTDLFCLGEGAVCKECLKMQEEALIHLHADRRRGRKTLAADRFRITEVLGRCER